MVWATPREIPLTSSGNKYKLKNTQYDDREKGYL
jgi:hypothetical protein